MEQSSVRNDINWIIISDSVMILTSEIRFIKDHFLRENIQ